MQVNITTKLSVPADRLKHQLKRLFCNNCTVIFISTLLNSNIYPPIKFFFRIMKTFLRSDPKYGVYQYLLK